jgi:hypothetical protein
MDQFQHHPQLLIHLGRERLEQTLIQPKITTRRMAKAARKKTAKACLQGL